MDEVPTNALVACCRSTTGSQPSKSNSEASDLHGEGCYVLTTCHADTKPPPPKLRWRTGRLRAALQSLRAAATGLSFIEAAPRTTFNFSSFCHFRNYDCTVHIISTPLFTSEISKMASSLSHPPAHLPPAVALQLSQQAPVTLQNTPSVISPYSVSSLWSAAETPELWSEYENLMLSCLRTSDEKSAHLCLQRLTERFGAENERLMALRGLFQEAIAKDDAALKQVLEEYETILNTDPSNMVGGQ